MLAFGNLSASTVLAILRYREFAPFTLTDTSPETTAKMLAFLDRADDPRKRVVLAEGYALATHARESVPDLESRAVVLAFDKPATWQTADLLPVDMDRAGKTLVIRKIDVNSMLEHTSYLAKPSNVEAPKPVEKKTRKPREAKQSLAAVFEPLVKKAPEKKQKRVAEWLAAHVAGDLIDSEWSQAVKLMTKSGIPYDDMEKAFKSAQPQIKSLQTKLKDPIDKYKLLKDRDVAWVHAHWPLSGLTTPA